MKFLQVDQISITIKIYVQTYIILTNNDNFLEFIGLMLLHL